MIGKSIGKLLKEHREKVGLTQKKIAKACGKTKGTISQLESGRLKDPPISLILSYLHTLGIPYSRFFSELEGKALQTEEKKQLEALKEVSERYEGLGLDLEINRPSFART